MIDSREKFEELVVELSISILTLMVLSTSRLLLEFLLQQIDLSAKQVDNLSSSLEFLPWDFKLVSVLVFFECGALVDKLLLT